MEKIKALQQNLLKDLHLGLSQDYKMAKLQKEIRKLSCLCLTNANRAITKELQIALDLSTLSRLSLKAQIQEQNHNALLFKQENLKSKLDFLASQITRREQEIEATSAQNLKSALDLKEQTRVLEAKEQKLEKLVQFKENLNAQSTALKGRIHCKELRYALELCAANQARLNLSVLQTLQIAIQARGRNAEELRSLRKKLEQEMFLLMQETSALLSKKEALEAEIFTLLQSIEEQKMSIQNHKESIKDKEAQAKDLSKESAELLKVNALQQTKIVSLLEQLALLRTQITQAQMQKLALNDAFYKLYGKIILSEGKLESICASSASLRSEII